MDGPVSDTRAMIAGMKPELMPGSYLFCTLRDPEVIARACVRARATFEESEGTSLILPADYARTLGLGQGPAMRQITLAVHSALDGVGLTAAVAGALAEAGIPCNMVAAFHHDHVFVPEDMAENALAALIKLQAAARGE